jgi:CheY-like chemotaxis protein
MNDMKNDVACLRLAAASLLLALFLLGASASESLAQEAPPPKPAPLVTDPLARDLLSTNPTTPSDILRVLDVLVELRQAKAGEPLLKQVVEMQLDDAKLASLYGEFGAALFAKLARTAELNPAAGQFADKVIAAANKHARDPQQISQLIELLKNPSSEVRAKAARQLQLGHGDAVTALLAVLADPSREAEFAHVEEALVALGGDTPAPLAAVFEGADTALKLRAIEVLGRVDRPDAQLALLAPAYGADNPAEIRQAARQALTAYADAPQDATAAAAKLYSTAATYFDQPPVMPTDPQGMVAVWFWDDEQKKPVSEPAPPQLAAFVMAALWSDNARQILPREPAIGRLHWGALLEAEVLRAGSPQAVPTDAESVYRELRDEGGIAVIEDLLTHWSSHGHPAVAAVAAQLLGETGETELLHSTGSQLSPLVKAVLNPDRRLRFAALSAIMKLEPDAPYPGSSFVADAIQFFINSSGGRAVLVGDERSSGVVQQSGLLASLGFDPHAARNRHEILTQGAVTADYEFVVLDMTLAGPLSGMILQDLRRDARTGGLPVAIVSSVRDFDEARALARTEPLTEAFLRPLDPDGMKTVVAWAAAKGTPSIVPAAERLKQAQQSIDWLVPLSQSRHSLYPIEQMEASLVASLGVPALRPAAISVLTNLHTPGSQRALVELASEGIQTLADRQLAAKAFAANVARCGTLLTTGEIITQYDLYNASERQEKPVQQVLASILDAIEAYARKHPG